LSGDCHVGALSASPRNDTLIETLPLSGEGQDRYLRDFFLTTLGTRGGFFDANVVAALFTVKVFAAVLDEPFPFALTGLTSVRICSCM